MSKLGMAFSIGKTNDERIDAFIMYQQAFNGKKISESTPPDSDDIHIVMEIGGINILLGPGGKVDKIIENSMCCEFHFDDENDLRKAYEILSDHSLSCSLDGPFPWATLLGLVVDKFGVCWALYFNK